jgi:peptide/nickel transport system substrate-binding protein
MINKINLLIFLSFALVFSIKAEYKEAPMWDKLVKEGKLPVVDKRLPEKPCVVKVADSIGQYGGTMYLATDRLKGFGDDLHIIGFEPPLFLNPDSSVSPNVVEKYEYSKDFKTLTLHLRKGIKWSDGYPLTTDDILFWWNDEVHNKDITELIYLDQLRNVVFKKIDDYTIKLIFKDPKPLYYFILAKEWGYQGRWWSPKHYLKQFNTHYVDKKGLLKRAKEEGFSTIEKYYNYCKANSNSAKPINVGCPTLTAFVLKEKKQAYWVWERNPYYFKVDEAGNQLPYIDKIVVKKIDDKETMQGQIISGQVDFAAWDTQMANIPLYKKYEKVGKYKTLIWQTSNASELKFLFNLTIRNPQLRELFRNKKFREAMSLAINRNEINKLLYFNMATPRQPVPMPESKYYNKETEKYCIKYDPVKANKILDEIGLDKRDKDGYRLFPNGKRVRFTLIHNDMEPVEKVPMSELVTDYCRKVGINVANKTVDYMLLVQRGDANELEVTNWNGGGVLDSSWPLRQTPPLPDKSTSYAPLWGKWYFTPKAKEKEEPSADIKRMMTLMKEISITTDEKKRDKMGKEIWDIYGNNIYEIGTVGMAPYPIIINDRLKNIPEKGVWGNDNLWMHPYHPEQFYFKQEGK